MSMPVISALDFTGDKMVDETAPIDSPMKRFYRDKTVLITGGTGFLGQLFIEKLLRCKVKEIYALARPKKNKSPTERIQETFVGVLFVRLKSIDPNYLTKIRIIEGDTSNADLGISDGDRKDIIENVEIVIHAAADVRFDKPLQELCFTNVRGTRVLTALAEEMKKLIVFAYVSTAFAQYHRERIEEKFYPPPTDPDEMIRIAEHFEKYQTEELNFLTDKLLQPWENTYVFTKSLSEEVVRRAVNKFPIVVIRPSIIISTYEDPIPAWSNNLYGINGMTVGTGLGFIKVSPCNAEAKSDVVCADFVTNGSLAAIWDKANEIDSTGQNNYDESKIIFHITSQDLLTNGSFFKGLRSLFFKFPSTKSIWMPNTTFCDTRLMFFILTIMYHVIPAFLLDIFFKLTNNKLRLLPIYRKSQDFLKRVVYFVERNWYFDNKNMKSLIEKMSEEDASFFPCDVFKFNLIEYSYSYMLGLRTYVVKEPINNYDAAKRKLLLLRIFYYSALIFYYLFLGLMIYLFLHVADLTCYFKHIYDNLIPLFNSI